ncbi:MAG: UDP-N-acetylmuramate--L-alanine ligase [Pseudomonadota bacterium]|nr:UDP-N-acetylmuramate--L-alanine ligase [Pseudomonadota bacterium]
MIKKIHFLGILGSGMSSLAIFTQEYGHQITGSDLVNPCNKKLPNWLNPNSYTDSYNQAFIDEADYVVYSSAIGDDHIELQYAKKLNKKILHRSELINIFTAEKKVISIAGTHGKTTTSSIMSWLFEQGNCQPSFIIGGIPANMPSAKFNQGEHLILEADESDGSFLKYKSDICIITNIEPDHLENHNHSIASYLDKFKTFITKTKICIYNIHDQYSNQLIKHIKNTEFHSFGFDSHADFQITHIENKDLIQLITLKLPCGDTTVIKTSLLGKYNAENVVAAWIGGYFQNIDKDNLSKHVEGFKGVNRRCEHIGSIKLNTKSIPIFDDYGHHPTECHSVLSEYRRQNKKIIHIFQPHRYSRLNHFFDEFIHALSLSDILLISDVFSAGEEKLNMKDSHDLVLSIKNLNKQVFYINDNHEIVDIVNQFIDNDSIVLFQGAGNISKIAHECVAIWNQN